MPWRFQGQKSILSGRLTARNDKKPRCRTEVDRRVGELKLDERYRNIFTPLVREVVASIGIHPVSRDAL